MGLKQLKHIRGKKGARLFCQNQRKIKGDAEKPREKGKGGGRGMPMRELHAEGGVNADGTKGH